MLGRAPAFPSLHLLSALRHSLLFALHLLSSPLHSLRLSSCAIAYLNTLLTVAQRASPPRPWRRESARSPSCRSSASSRSSPSSRSSEMSRGCPRPCGCEGVGSPKNRTRARDASQDIQPEPLPERRPRAGSGRSAVNSVHSAPCTGRGEAASCARPRKLQRLEMILFLILLIKHIYSGSTVAVASPDTRPAGARRRRRERTPRRTPDHLYGARLRLHKKLNSKSCSSRDSPSSVVLGIFDFRPSEVTDHAWPPIDASPRGRWSA